MSRDRFDSASDTTYGLAGQLLDEVSGPGIVLDLGCGEGRFAQAVTELGRAYVGVDLDAGSVGRCRTDGLDVHHIDLADPDRAALHGRLLELVDGRQVGAVSMLDVIDHLVDPVAVFADLAVLLDRLGGPTLVVSLPNVSHIDLATKLLFGRWDATSSGLFDGTNVTFFDEAHLAASTTAAGFIEVARRDRVLTVTEQEFPLDHPAINRATPVRMFAETIRGAADDHRNTYQFVRAYRHDPAAVCAVSVDAAPSGPPGPFCSVLVRTQGGRDSVDDALTCLAAQTDRDLEVILTVHTDDDPVVESVQARVDSYAVAFAERVRVVKVSGGGRAAPLNVGLELARGRYMAFLDDDDVVTANWIEEFRAAAESGPGTILRAQCAVQEHTRTPEALVAFAPTGGFDAPFNLEFDFFQHRQLNQSPICSWAVPLGAVRALRLRFDDELPVCEDWEFLVRAASLLGVSNRVTFTSIYRRFTDGWGSTKTIHEKIWLETSIAIRRRLDEVPTLVPAGSIEPISHLREQAAALSAAYSAALARIHAYERSRYWRMLAPLRWLTSQRGDSISKARRRGASLVRRSDLRPPDAPRGADTAPLTSKR